MPTHAWTDVAQRLLAEPDFVSHLCDLLGRPQRQLEAIADSMNVCRHRRAAAILTRQIRANSETNEVNQFVKLLYELDDAIKREAQP
ncbi:MAG: hypothetical protein V3T84_14605 [Phycisphaerales bacterium]